DAHQHRDLAMAPGREAIRVCDRHRFGPVGRRRRPRPLHRPALPLAGLPAPVRALRHADQLREARGRHPGLEADHLEFLVGPSRCSALFFQTRSSTCASPSAAFNSSTSSSNCRSRRFGPGGPPSTRPALPLSKNCCFQREIDCSLALPRRAASTIVISPLMTARTSLNLSSTEKTGGRANGSSLHEEPDITPMPEFVKRDTTPRSTAISLSGRPLRRYNSTASRRNSGGYGLLKFDPLGMVAHPPRQTGRC